MSGAAASVAAIVRAAGPHVPPLLARVEERLTALAASHGPLLAQHAGATIRAGGKRLRPLLVLLAAGPDAHATGDVVAAATAVELVHSATLVHDDVLDAAALRRGVPTVWASAGRDMAIATGDLLFSRAFSELAATGSLEAVRTLSHAGSALAEGELRQRQDAWNVAVGVDRYLARCELKTARLFEASCRLGALAAAGEQAVVDGLGAFGRRIGLAFQILDDVLDVTGDAARTGKHRGTDLLDGTVTLPLILARERDTELAAVDLRAIDTPAQAGELCARIEATGATAAATDRALAIVGEAKAQLARLALDGRQREALDLVADSVVDRRA
jgi:geranylgeranyl pyrophosphate synthase